MKHYIALFSLLFLLSGCQAGNPVHTSGTVERLDVEVTEVVDGDTIKIMYNGKEETVRYLLIDTPETRHPRLGKQPLGEEAKKENEKIIEAGDISIEFDVGERFDDYGRLLAYVYADGESVQEQLIESGHARVAYVFPPNTRYLDEFEETEAAARSAGIGIWKYENYATDRGFDSEAVEESAQPAQSSGKCLIKGNINRRGDKIYHLEGSDNYSQTNPEQWFCSEKEAQKAGFRKAAN